MRGGAGRARIVVPAAVALGAVGLAGIIGFAASADVRYVARAAWEEGRILLRRESLANLAADTTTPPSRRAVFQLVLDARAFAREGLGLDPGDTYTTYADVGRDTLLLLLTAAPPDSFTPYTWWFPIVGRVPYKGFFGSRDALAESDRLSARGYDVYLRPAGAFSTLGWFEDPLLSTALSDDPVQVAETVIHETAHHTLYVRGATAFDESFALFVGYRGAEALFRSREDSAGAARAAALWRDQLRLGRFYQSLAAELRTLYASGAPRDSVLAGRETLFAAARERLRGPLADSLELYRGARLADQPLNNAALVAAIIYRTKLELFERLYQLSGRSVRAAVTALAGAIAVRPGEEPFGVLERLLAATPPVSAQ